MGDGDAGFPNPPGPGKRMAYHKVSAVQKAQYLDNEDLQATTLELEWDMEKELEELGYDHFQLDGTVRPQAGTMQNTDVDLEPGQPSASPKGRFQRLQEDPDYVSHYTRPLPKSHRCSFRQMLKLFCSAVCLLLSGILIGYYGHEKCRPPPASPEPSRPHLDQDILEDLRVKDIAHIFRQKGFHGELQAVKIQNTAEHFERRIYILL